MNKRQITTIATIIILAIVMAIAYIVYIQISRVGKAPLIINVLPESAKVVATDKKTRGKTVIANGEVYLPSGEYTISATASGFDTTTRDVSLTDSNKPTVILSPQPVSEEAQNWVADHQSEYEEQEGIAGSGESSAQKSLAERYPIVSSLPYEDPYYQIGYRTPSNDEFIVTVYTDSPQYRYEAIQKIYELGHNPSDYKIEYVDYKNPLGV